MAVHDCCAGEARKANGSYDLAVIGAGSAGFSAAIAAAELGANVALIGHGTIGGACVNVGCLPSKTMIRATEMLHHAPATSPLARIRAKRQLADWRDEVGAKEPRPAAPTVP